MREKISSLLLLLTVLYSGNGEAYVESLASTYLYATSAPHFEPQIAMQCGYINQYMDKSGHWVMDTNKKATCLENKLAILEYCRKVYPDLDITNIVEASHYQKIESWCKLDSKKCKGIHWVKPYRCLVGPFQSDALLVPEHCLFDHIHNQSKCMTFDEWNRTATKSCFKRGMGLLTFAMLLPCGIDVFSGVEFVCCPKNKDGVPTDSTETDKEEFESKQDKYFSLVDPNNEHEEFRAAEKRLEDNHREKVTEVMKQWSELEQRYQEMKAKDPKGAEQFKKEMTARFQKTVAALEEEGAAEKKQLVALHQQRVEAALNERKRQTMEHYMESLQQSPPKPHKIQKTLEKFIRAEEKDRTHTINHYKHILNINPEEGTKMESQVLAHLDEITNRINQSISMLDHVPDIALKLKPKIEAFWKSFHEDKDPESADVVLRPISKETEEAILEKYKAEIAKKHEEKEKEKLKKQQMREEMREMRVEAKKVEQNAGKPVKFDPESMEDETVAHINQAVNRNSHAQNEAIYHESGNYIKKTKAHPEFVKRKWLYITFAFAGVALLTVMIVGIVLLRKRSQHHPASQGFIEVDQAATPEERHVANMQVNGYENPTYKYFETQN